MNEEELRQLYDEFLSQIHEIYPSFKVSNTSAFGINGIYNGGEIEFSLTQESFSNSEFTENIGKEFIHYTSMENFYSIINNDSIRLYDLLNLNDPLEFECFFKNNNIEIDKNQVENFKKYLYVFSMCKYDSSLKDNFNMWRNYGKDGNGIGIVFELVNDNWYNFVLSKVKYIDNDENQKKVKILFEIIEKYKKLGINTSRIPILFAKLALLHKNKIWDEENETRIVSYFEYNQYDLNPELNFTGHFDENIINYYIDKKGKVSSFLSLELENKLQEKIKTLDKETALKSLNTLPRFRIKSIIPGFRISIDAFFEIQKFIYYTNRKKNLNIEISPSKYSEYFKQFER